MLDNITPDYRYSSQQAAELLGVLDTTLKKWREKKKGPTFYQFVKRGACQYLGKDLIEFVRASRVDCVV